MPDFRSYRVRKSGIFAMNRCSLAGARSNALGIAQRYPKQIAGPDGLILVEGHTRFNVGLYLNSIGQLDQADIWLMRASAHKFDAPFLR